MPCSSMQKPPSPYNKPSSNPATRNHAPQCKQTMPRHTHYSPTKSYPKHSRPWTFVSTGYGAAMPKDDSVITGDLAHKSWQITSQSITPQHTTSLYAQQSPRQSTIQNTGNSSRTQETPQNWRAQIITRETKTSKNRHKSLKWRAQKNYAQNQTSKNLQKIAKLEGTINTPPIKNSRYCQKTAELEGTQNTPPSKHS